MDPERAAVAGRPWATGDAALRALGGPEPVLWPSTRRRGPLDAVNYGVSPGDSASGAVAYVGPHEPAEGPFGTMRSARRAR